MLNFYKSYDADILDLACKQSNDFLSPTQVSPWTGAAIATGSSAGTTGTALHPGVIAISSSASVNSGYRHMTGTSNILLAGGEDTHICFKTGAALSPIIRKMGFHNSTNSADPVDGVYCKILDGVITGQTANASSISITTSNYLLTANTWYRLEIFLNNNATLATFKLFEDNSLTVLWTDSLNTNIPTAETGHGDVITKNTGGATVIGSLDYMDVCLPKARRVN